MGFFGLGKALSKWQVAKSHKERPFLVEGCFEAFRMLQVFLNSSSTEWANLFILAR